MKGYNPQKQEWGTDASVKRAKKVTPKEGKKVKRFSNWTEENNGPEAEKEMMMTQINFMHHALDGITKYIEQEEDVEEWYQNKLSGLYEKMKGMYAYSKGEMQ